MQIKNLFQSKGFQRLIEIVLLALILYAKQSMLNLILITFMLTYLMDRFQNFIYRKLDHFMPINLKIIIALLYVMLV
ncbi:AI-2E family transporter, partial [Bacillus mycoides]|nr:AI-2E family transporter [Bacillus mycoides]